MQRLFTELRLLQCQPLTCAWAASGSGTAAAPCVPFRTAMKKAGGSTKNTKGSNSQRLGVKLFHGAPARAGNIIIRQRGTKWRPGANVGVGKDHTIYSLIQGRINFYQHPDTKRTHVEVLPFAPDDSIFFDTKKVLKWGLLADENEHRPSDWSTQYRCSVRGLSPGVSETELRDSFAAVGTVVSASVVRDSSGRRYGYVAFASHAAAKRAALEAQQGALREALVSLGEGVEVQAAASSGTFIVLSNVPQVFGDEEVAALFSRLQPPLNATSAEVEYDATGCSRGVAVVGFESADNATRAMHSVQVLTVLNSTLEAHVDKYK